MRTIFIPVRGRSLRASLRHGSGAAIVRFALALAACGALLACAPEPPTELRAFPGPSWARRSPGALGVDADKLDTLSELVGGRGCVVHRGYLVYSWGDISKSEDVASAFKPVVSTLLLFAIQEGRLAGPDARVADFEPRLKELNHGLDGDISWRHLASQTSGYGHSERPGEAYSYNDYALALYYDTLTARVFGQPGNDVLRSRLGEPLGFQDEYTFEPFGPDDRPGRLAISVRDFARFGLLYLRAGQWNGAQLLAPELIRLAVESPVPPELPLASGQPGEMLPGQRTIGGGKAMMAIGPGFYSFNWWLNGLDRQRRRLLVDAPPDAYLAQGKGGRAILLVVPSRELVVSWNGSPVNDLENSPGNPETELNRAVRLLRDAVPEPAALPPAQ